MSGTDDAGDASAADGVDDADAAESATPRLPPVEAVCFDLDDTLFDFTQYVEAGLRSAADVVEARTGRALHDEAVALYFDEGVTENTFDRLLDRHDLPSDLVPALVEAYHGHDDPLSPYPETTAVLDRLSAEYRLGLVTDGRNGREKLRRLDLADRFEYVFVCYEAGIDKREPAAFERALDALDVSPAEAVYVGDNPAADFRESNRLGMHTVRLLKGRYVDRDPRPGEAADYRIDDLADLLDLLGLDRPGDA